MLRKARHTRTPCCLKTSLVASVLLLAVSLVVCHHRSQACRLCQECPVCLPASLVVCRRPFLACLLCLVCPALLRYYLVLSVPRVYLVSTTLLLPPRILPATDPMHVTEVLHSHGPSVTNHTRAAVGITVKKEHNLTDNLKLLLEVVEGCQHSLLAATKVAYRLSRVCHLDRASLRLQVFLASSRPLVVSSTVAANLCRILSLHQSA